MHRFRVEAQPHTAIAAERFQFVEQRLGDDALAVIAHDDGVGLRQSRLDGGKQTAGEGRRDAVARFAVNAHDLLGLGDNAGFEAGAPGGTGHQPATADVLGAEQSAQLLGGGILADDPEQFRVDAESGEVAGHVGRAAGHEALALKIHHGDRASGEMRATLPQMNWSSMRSPTTRTRLRAAVWSSCRTRAEGSGFCFMVSRGRP